VADVPGDGYRELHSVATAHIAGVKLCARYLWSSLYLSKSDYLHCWLVSSKSEEMAYKRGELTYPNK